MIPGAYAPAPSPVGRPQSGGRWWILGVIGVLAVIALVAGIGAVLVIRSDDASAEEVVLEPVGYQQPDGFTPTVTTHSETPPPSTAVR